MYSIKTIIQQQVNSQYGMITKFKWIRTYMTADSSCLVYVVETEHWDRLEIYVPVEIDQKKKPYVVKG